MFGANEQDAIVRRTARPKFHGVFKALQPMVGPYSADET